MNVDAPTVLPEEHYDVLDEKGNKTGQVLPKSVVHEQELWHASVFVWIYDDNGEVLLQLRSKDKKAFPGVWDVSVAGHISSGATPEITAVWETEEEIGIHIDPSDLTKVEYTSDVVPWLPDKKHPEFCNVYILHKNLEINDLKIEKSELTQVRKIPIDELLKELKDPIKSKVYTARNPRIYETALHEIQERLKV